MIELFIVCPFYKTNHSIAISYEAFSNSILNVNFFFSADNDGLALITVQESCKLDRIKMNENLKSLIFQFFFFNDGFY